MEVIDLINDGSGLGFGIVGGKSTGVVVKTILPGGVADRVSSLGLGSARERIYHVSFSCRMVDYKVAITYYK